MLANSGIRAERLLKAGNPAEEIINAAAEGRFDVILVGVRGMGAVRRFLIGSVTDRVVRHATVPVLVVR
jgi:nucleotide-binding universal stress UspA family protein